MSIDNDLVDRAALMDQGKAVFCPDVLMLAAARIRSLEAKLAEAREHVDLLGHHPAHDETAMQRRAMEWLKANPRNDRKENQ